GELAHHHPGRSWNHEFLDELHGAAAGCKLLPAVCADELRVERVSNFKRIGNSACPVARSLSACASSIHARFGPAVGTVALRPVFAGPAGACSTRTELCDAKH